MPASEATMTEAEIQRLRRIAEAAERLLVSFTGRLIPVHLPHDADWLNDGMRDIRQALAPAAPPRLTEEEMQTLAKHTDGHDTRYERAFLFCKAAARLRWLEAERERRG